MPTSNWRDQLQYVQQGLQHGLSESFRALTGHRDPPARRVREHPDEPPHCDPMFRPILLAQPKLEVKDEIKEDPDVLVPERWNQTQDLSPIPRRDARDEFADDSHEELRFEDAEETIQGEEPMEVDVSDQAAATPLPVTPPQPPPRPRSAQQRDHDEMLRERVANAARILRQGDQRALRAANRARQSGP